VLDVAANGLDRPWDAHRILPLEWFALPKLCLQPSEVKQPDKLTSTRQ